MGTTTVKVVGIGVVIAGVALGAQQAPPAPAACTITGTITGLGNPLPGVSITVRRGDTLQTATSTDIDGTFKVSLPDASYQLTAELTGFDKTQKDLVVSREERREGVPGDRDACGQKVDFTLGLTPRTAATTPNGAPSATVAAGRGAGARGGRGGAGRGAGANETPEQAAQRRFESLEVNENADTRSLDPSAFESIDPSIVTPAGFGTEALADAFAVTGEAARVDRGALNDRADAFRRGEFQLPDNLDPRLLAGFEGRGFNPADFQGRGGNPNFQGRGGPQGGGQDFPGGRGGRGNPNFRGGQRVVVQSTYNFSGSALNAAPKQLRSEVAGIEPRSANHNYSLQTQIPIKLPGIYANTNNRTMLQIQYSGSTGTNPFDQYATVPTDAMRRGDFSAVGTPLIDPLTGQAFPGNVIPLDRISPQAQALLAYYPSATLDGTTRNYHRAATTFNRQNQVQLRLQHSFTGNQAGGRGGRGGGQPQGGRGGQAANGGRGGRGAANTRTNVNMNLNFQYSRSDNDQLNVFTTLGGQRESRNYSISDSFNIQHGRNQFTASANYNHSWSGSVNNFSGINNVSNAIGIQGVSDSPFAWGLPRLSFSSISGLSDVNPSVSAGDRVGTNFTWRRPVGRHQIQTGGTFNYDSTTTNNESNANGQFVFTGIYTANGGVLAGRNGFDFADFLLGMPQQATIAYGPGETTLTGRDWGVFFQDEWRARGNLTFNLGVRWDLRYPFVEENGRLVNLDVTSDFSAAAPVASGSEGAFTGSFPRALIEKDTNNISPRLAVAWRGPGQMQYRSSWEIQYNDSTYSGIARRLAQQPPFATTGTNIGGLSRALLLEDALTGIDVTETRNNYGIDRDYVVGTAQQAVFGVQRQLFRTYQVSAQYGHTIGSNLEIVRAPNRDADGLRIEGVQPFTWTSSEGRSTLDSATFDLRKNESRGFGYQLSYTVARSRDNSPSLSGGGGGGTGNVAQDDQNIDAEWARSSFIQRHRFTVSANYRFPFGPNERWLRSGGFFAGIAGGWRVSGNFSANSGSPQSVTVSGAARDISSGINGALRADYNGESVMIADPTIDQWFNTAAFSVPAAGEFGSSPRNIIVGPGSKNLNMTFNRNVQLGGNRNIDINMQVNNILNLANYQGVDTNVNSPTFGQIRSVSGQRRATLRLNFRF